MELTFETTGNDNYLDMRDEYHRRTYELLKSRTFHCAHDGCYCGYEHLGWCNKCGHYREKPMLANPKSGRILVGIVTDYDLATDQCIVRLKDGTELYAKVASQTPIVGEFIVGRPVTAPRDLADLMAHFDAFQEASKWSYEPLRVAGTSSVRLAIE